MKVRLSRARKVPGTCKRNKLGQDVIVRQTNRRSLVERTCLLMKWLCPMVQAEQSRRVEKHQSSS